MKTTIIVIVLILLSAGLTWLMISGPGDGADPDAITMPSGVKYVELQVGAGREAKTGDSVAVHYTGRLTNGKKFDSSLDRGEPFTFKLGKGDVIKGWDLGVVGMKEGGKRKLIIPAALAYGERSPSKDIPPNSTLVFEVELLKVK